MKVIDYYYTPTSPYTYLGAPRLGEIAKAAGATIVHKPVDYGRVFPASGGLPLKQRARQRQSYRLIELQRWGAWLNMPINLHPAHFPVSGDLAAKAIIAATQQGYDPGPFSFAVLSAVWADERDISNRDTLLDLARRTGMHGEALLAAAETEAAAAAYDALTQEAIDLGVFGAPTYIYRDELFWGQDRLDFLERALAQP